MHAGSSISVNHEASLTVRQDLSLFGGMLQFEMVFPRNSPFGERLGCGIPTVGGALQSPGAGLAR